MEERKLSDVCVRLNGKVANICITRESKLNALNSQVLHQLYDCFYEVERSNQVNVIVLSGAGEKAFAAGADLKEITQKETVDDLRTYYAEFDWLYEKMSSIPQPIIARVNGYAFGGGCLLALASDLVIASEDALFSQPEVNFGFTGGAALLPRLVGRHKAAEITMLAKNIKAEEAYRLGLVNKVVAKEDLDLEVEKMCATLLKKDAFALAMIKRIIKNSMNMGLCAANQFENEAAAICLERKESKSAIIGFINK